MKTPPFSRRATFALALTGLSALVVAACSSDNGNPQPNGGNTTSIVGSSSSGTMMSGSSTSSSSGGTGGMGTGGMTGSGCVMGTPMSNTDFLNACNGMTCNAFDNKGRLPLLKMDGSLPALP